MLQNYHCPSGASAINGERDSGETWLARARGHSLVSTRLYTIRQDSLCDHAPTLVGTAGLATGVTKDLVPNIEFSTVGILTYFAQSSC